MFQLIYGVIVWLVVPGIILAVLLFGLVISTRVSPGERKVSARAGFWAGLLLFVAYAVSQLQSLGTPDFSYLPQFSLIPIIIGFAVGFFFLWGLKLWFRHEEWG